MRNGMYKGHLDERRVRFLAFECFENNSKEVIQMFCKLSNPYINQSNPSSFSQKPGGKGEQWLLDSHNFNDGNFQIGIPDSPGWGATGLLQELCLNLGCAMTSEMLIKYIGNTRILSTINSMYLNCCCC